MAPLQCNGPSKWRREGEESEKEMWIIDAVVLALKIGKEGLEPRIMGSSRSWSLGVLCQALCLYQCPGACQEFFSPEDMALLPSLRDLCYDSFNGACHILHTSYFPSIDNTSGSIESYDSNRRAACIGVWTCCRSLPCLTALKSSPYSPHSIFRS